MALRVATFACLALVLLAATGCQCFSVPSVRYHEPCGPGTAPPLPCDEAWQIAQTKHAEETAPAARFHPVPTRPVFAASPAIAARDSSTAIPQIQLHAPQMGSPPTAPGLTEPPLLRAPEELTPPPTPKATSEPKTAPINPADRGVTRRIGRGDIRFINGARQPSVDRWQVKR